MAYQVELNNVVATVNNQEWTCALSQRFETDLNDVCGPFVVGGESPDADYTMAINAVALFGAKLISSPPKGPKGNDPPGLVY